MLKKLSFLLIVLAVIGFWFVPAKPIIEWRNDIALKLLDAGHEKIPHMLYKRAMQQGDLLGANNMHVLDYRAARERTEDSRRARVPVNREYRAIFDDLSNKGLAVGTYNRALFEFRCAVRQECYETGKARFLKAHEQGDPLAEAAFALTLSYTEPKGDPDRKALLKAAADKGNAHAAFTYSTIVWGTDKEEGRKYALMSVATGNSHAEDHLAYFYKGEEQRKWLEKAATNPKFPRRQAAKLLGTNYLAGINGFEVDHEKSRYWFQKAATIDSKFSHPLITREDGLRWRDIGTGFNSGKLTPGFAAYDLAILNYCGMGGPQSMDAFHKYIRAAAELKIFNSKDILREVERAPRESLTTKTPEIAKLITEQMNKRSYNERPVFKACLA